MRLLEVAPFTFSIRSDIDFVFDELQRLYGDLLKPFAPESQNAFIDYQVAISDAGGLRRFFKRQARFLCDQKEPFKPLTACQAYAMLEWGMNWTIAAHEASLVIIHAAVLEKNGHAVIFPAPPGSGKSTLTAYLAMNGWRLLSDEMALIDPNTLNVIPFVRPICLKNKSIELAQSWFPTATFSRIARDTHKGDVIHMAPPKSAWDGRFQKAKVCAFVFPNFRANHELELYKLNHLETFNSLSENAFNYSAMGDYGFQTVCRLVESTSGFEIFYSQLSEVMAFLEEDVIA